MGRESDDGTLAGSFASRDGECSVSFSTFTLEAIEGRVECQDMPGSRSDPQLVSGPTTMSFRAIFSFDPISDAFERPGPLPSG